jgi:predicted dehydrogenase
MRRAIVVGAGGIAGAWFGPLRDEGVQIAAVVDVRPEAAQKRIDDFDLAGAVATDDLARALAEHECDFVVDLTVPDAHCAVTCQALEAGRHVIGEKPMAATIAQARRMVAAAEKADRLYMVSQSRRWNAGASDVAAAIAGRKLGKLTAIRCDFFLHAPFGGFRAEMAHVLLADMAIHHFDLARRMGGVDPLSVYAEDFNTPGSWARHGVGAAALFRMTDDVRFTYAGSWCARGRSNSWDGDWRFQCTEGSVFYEQGGRGTAFTSDPKARPTAPPEQRDIRVDQPDHRGQRAALRELLAYLDGGPVPGTECHDNIKSFAMVCAAIESCRTGKPVDIARMIQ